MASLSVRKLDTETLRALRIQAAKHGISMEEEARQILKRGLQYPQAIGDIAQNLFGPKQGIDLKLPSRIPHQPLDLGE